eukprot:CAMPEP_0194517306 /NCGR_PEP_ID=MMETSP0253-20130528/50431_1 /TAXON_ID=2966 /ORGANISM="Noctiluca scintillans" /LENGTH=105 /DNA_ID=CAMNT_0039361245 /DNA_START=13 /DNA_END=327 /DNA_ORIENTATION=-
MTASCLRADLECPRPGCTMTASCLPNYPGCPCRWLAHPQFFRSLRQPDAEHRDLAAGSPKALEAFEQPDAENRDQHLAAGSSRVPSVRVGAPPIHPKALGASGKK